MANNTPRKIQRGTAVKPAAQSTGKQGTEKVAHAAAKPKKQKKEHTGLRWFFRIVVTLGCLGLMGCAALAVFTVNYMVEATANDDLDLDTLTQSMSSIVMVQNPDTGEWYEDVVLKSSNSHRLQASLDEIPESLRWAFICTEDKDFYTEPGFNLKRTIAAAINEYTPIRLFGSKQGASTLEQQLIKNLYDDDDSSGLGGITRKLREIFRAWGLARNFSKETVLEAYLNTISFTDTIQGVQTAAFEYFGKDCMSLNLQECAVIASITKSPTEYNPYTNPENLIARRNLVLYNMYTQGKISEAEYNEAKNAPLVLTEENGDEVVTTRSNYSYFDDALYNQLVKDFMAANGWERKVASNYVYTAGLTIYSTENPFIQKQMEEVMLNVDDKTFPAGWTEEEVAELSERDIPVYEADGVTLKTTTDKDGNPVYYRKVRTQAAMATVDYEGNVLAVVGGVGEKTTDLALNRATDAPRQTGSSMKPLASYALGIEYGLVNWSTMLNDSPLYAKEDMIIRNDDYCRKHGLRGLSDEALKAYPDAWRDWPKNYGNSYSMNDIYVWDGLQKSLNTIATRVGDLVGVDAMYYMAHDTLQLSYFVEQDRNYSSLILGGQSYGATPLQMAAAYAIFNEGKYTVPRFYSKVYDHDGNLVLEAETTSYQALTPQGATVMNRLLRNVLVSGTAGGKTPKAGGMEAVGKTGTASDNKDLWFVGCTPYYCTAVWWGYDNPIDMTSSKAVGKNAKTSVCSAAWKELMERIQGNLEYRAFPVAEGVVTRQYCTASGLLATGSCASTATGYYLEDALPDPCDYGY